MLIIGLFLYVSFFLHVIQSLAPVAILQIFHLDFEDVVGQGSGVFWSVYGQEISVAIFVGRIVFLDFLYHKYGYLFVVYPYGCFLLFGMWGGDYGQGLLVDCFLPSPAKVLPMRGFITLFFHSFSVTH